MTTLGHVLINLNSSNMFLTERKQSCSWGGGGGGGGGGGAAAPIGPVMPDTSSLWMEMFSLDLDILIIVSCNYNCLPFSYLRSSFQRHFKRSAENSISEPPYLKIFWGRIPPHPLQSSCLQH